MKKTLIILFTIGVLLLTNPLPTYAAEESGTDLGAGCFNVKAEIKTKDITDRRKEILVWIKVYDPIRKGQVKLDLSGKNIAPWTIWENYPQPFIFPPEKTRPFSEHPFTITYGRGLLLIYTIYHSNCLPNQQNYQNLICTLRVDENGSLDLKGDKCVLINEDNKTTSTPSPTKPSPIKPSPTSILYPTLPLTPTPTPIIIKVQPTNIPSQNKTDSFSCQSIVQKTEGGYCSFLSNLTRQYNINTLKAKECLINLKNNKSDLQNVACLEKELLTPLKTALQEELNNYNQCYFNENNRINLFIFNNILQGLKTKKYDSLPSINFVHKRIMDFMNSDNYDEKQLRPIITDWFTPKMLEQTLGKQIEYLKQAEQSENKSFISKVKDFFIPPFVKYSWNIIFKNQFYDPSGAYHQAYIEGFINCLENKPETVSKTIENSLLSGISFGADIALTIIPSGKIARFVGNKTGINKPLGKVKKTFLSTFKKVAKKAGNTTKKIASTVYKVFKKEGVKQVGSITKLSKQDYEKLAEYLVQYNLHNDEKAIRETLYYTLKRAPKKEEINALKTALQRKLSSSTFQKSPKLGNLAFRGTVKKILNVINLKHGQDAAAVVEENGKRIVAVVADGVSGVRRELIAMGYTPDSPTKFLVSEAAKALEDLAKGKINLNQAKARLSAINSAILKNFPNNTGAATFSGVVKLPDGSLAIFKVEDARVFGVYRLANKIRLIDLTEGKDVLTLAYQRSDKVWEIFGSSNLNIQTSVLDKTQTPRRLIVATDGLEKVIKRIPKLEDTIIQILHSFKTEAEAEQAIKKVLLNTPINVDDIGFAVMFLK